MRIRRVAPIVLLSFVLGGGLAAAGVGYLRPPQPSTVLPIELQDTTPGVDAPDPSLSPRDVTQSSDPGDITSRRSPDGLSKETGAPQLSVVPAPAPVAPAPASNGNQPGDGALPVPPLPPPPAGDDDLDTDDGGGEDDDAGDDSVGD